jgi:hypothetical protein
MSMQINNENQARDTIEQWKEKNVLIQLRLIREAMAGQELAYMYYEQKANEQGMVRADTILAILLQRKEEIENQQPRGK